MSEENKEEAQEEAQEKQSIVIALSEEDYLQYILGLEYDG